MPAYRADVDGLRAIAVLAVIAFHCERSLLPGGFTGVDMFFTISGFLITGILIKRIEVGEFTFSEFYLRRIKRIVPVFLIVLTTTIFLGFLLLQPNALIDLSKSALWSIFSGANIYFYRNTPFDYFAESSDKLPLLHLWSLGIEEQFYLLWPALLVFFRRRGGSYFYFAVLTLLVSTLSIGFTEFYLRQSSDFNRFAYYMLPTRCGELLIGALVATFLQSKSAVNLLKSKHIGAIMTLIGVGFIAVGCFYSNETLPFPGLRAMLPCGGTALVIIAGSYNQNIITAILGSRPFVAIGLRSYSLYLWHWPVLAFTRYFVPNLDAQLIFICLLVTITLSFASYRFTEVPLRQINWRPRQVVLSFFVIPNALLLIFLGLFLQSKWLSLWVEKATVAQHELNSATKLVRHSKINACVKDTNCQLLWGDSNAMHYFGMVRSISKEFGRGLLMHAEVRCPPVLNWTHGNRTEKCSVLENQVKESLNKFETVILAGQWINYFQASDFKEKMSQTIDFFSKHGKNVRILAQVPILRKFDRFCALKRERLPLLDCLTLSQTEFSHGYPARTKAVNDYLAQLARRYKNVRFFDVTEYFCKEGRCSPYLTGLSRYPLYFDSTHLSSEGSRLLGEQIAKKSKIQGIYPLDNYSRIKIPHNL